MLTQQDKNIILQLQKNGRMPIVELAKITGMSESTCLRRTRYLEESGIIKGYRAIVDSDRVGFAVTAFVQVSIDQQSEDYPRSGRILDFRATISTNLNILQIGDFFYFLHDVFTKLFYMSVFINIL